MKVNCCSWELGIVVLHSLVAGMWDKKRVGQEWNWVGRWSPVGAGVLWELGGWL